MINLLPHAVDDAAERSPQRRALRFLEQSLTYSELAHKTNCLANALMDAGVRKQDRVGIYMDKSLEMAIALYGIMKAGAAYVPLDPSAPEDRLIYILRDCGIRHLVTADNKLETLRSIEARTDGLECLIGVKSDPDLRCRVVPWDQVFSAPGDRPPGMRIIEKDLAYIIYTSGSTGVPKGIMHTHYSGLSFARWAADEYGFGPDDVLSNHAPLHFDLSTLDFFSGALAGSTTTIIPEAYTKLPASYSKLIADQRVTVLYTVPSALIQLLLRGMMNERDLGSLRWIIYGGEPFPTKYLRALMARLPHVQFDNMYGPAETNGCSHHTIERLGDSDHSVPIGRMASIADVLVVDEAGQSVVPGEAGELLVRSPTMMEGYWGRADLNAGAFESQVTFESYERVYYRTGDLVRQDENGLFWFLGRKDRQIKVRGYRIELDEVEAALSSIPTVEEAAAFPVPDGEGSHEIRAAVTLKQGATATSDDLLTHLRARLPWYGVPSAVTRREDFPRTSTGKIDRKTLRQEALTEDENRESA